MSETTAAPQDTAVQAAAAAIIEAAQEIQAGASTATQTEAQKTATATAIYTAWRNTYLGEIPADAFNRIEQQSQFLITAIAAAI